MSATFHLSGMYPCFQIVLIRSKGTVRHVLKENISKIIRAGNCSYDF